MFQNRYLNGKLFVTYHFIISAESKLLLRGYSCLSSDTRLDSYYGNPVENCATACHKKTGCKYFIIGNDGYSETCRWEKTSDPSCPEGLKRDSYDFYELTGKLLPSECICTKQ